MKIPTIQKRVEAGVACLNVVRPKWLKKIDTDNMTKDLPKTHYYGDGCPDKHGTCCCFPKPKTKKKGHCEHCKKGKDSEGKVESK